jgi:glycine hydroxymethyltransferase
LLTWIPIIARAIQNEAERQETGLELIASENFVSAAVLEATGTVFTNKYAVGYPGRRYYGGCEYVDVVESLAISRAKTLFGAEHANVQPHSGAQANMSCSCPPLKPGDTILGMNLAHGGHLTHGHPAQLLRQVTSPSSRMACGPKTSACDYDALAKLADVHRPKLIIVGASAYPRVFDFARVRQVCRQLRRADDDRHGAHRGPRRRRLVHPSPVPHSRLRDYYNAQDPARAESRHGPLPVSVRKRGDKAFSPACRADRCARDAAKAVCLNGSGRTVLRHLPTADRSQCIALAGSDIAGGGYRLVRRRTDNHLMLVDVFSKGLTGKVAEASLGKAGIHVNNEAIRSTRIRPLVASGIRIGTPAVTTRGMTEKEMDLVGD